MYNLMLEINRKCNLKCKYCYLGDKDNKEITHEIFKNVVEICTKEALKQYDKTINVNFIGGEPLLDFHKIVCFIEYIEKRYRETGLRYIYGITTNGTIFNDEIINYLIEKNFNLKVSIDGGKDAHDINRCFHNGAGSYPIILENIKFIRKYEENTKKHCIVANVISENNISHLSESLKNIHSLGFKILESGINIYDDWNDEKINILKKEITESFRFYKKIKKHGDDFRWMYIENKLKSFFVNETFYSCKAGLNSSFVDLEGIFYTCGSNKEFKIGDYRNGMDYSKVRNIVYCKDSPTASCFNCKYVNHCTTRSCLINNFEKNNNIYHPVNINCIQTKIIFDIFDNELEKEQKKIFSHYFNSL